MSQLGDLMRALGASIMKLVRKGLFKDEPDLFIADFNVSASYSPPAGLYSHADLLLTLMETKGGHTHLVTFWKDEDAFNKVQTAFRSAAGVTGANLTRRIARGPSPARWRWDWVKFPAVVWTIISTLGLGGWLLGFFTAPDFGAIAPDVPPDMVVDKEYSLKFDLVNRLAKSEAHFTQKQVKFVPLGGEKKGVADVVLTETEHRLAGAAKETIVMRAQAAGDIAGIGHFTVKVVGSGRAGWLRGSQLVELDLGHVVRVWPRLRARRDPVHSPTPQNLGLGGTVVVVHYLLESGVDEDKGIDIEAFLTGPADGIAIAQATFQDRRFAAKSAPVHKWHTAPIAKFTVTPFTVTLFAGKARSDWDKVVERLEVRLP